jgi:ribosomal protein S18 acetylase RimI-like enzyme
MLFCSAPGRQADAQEVASLVDAACSSRPGPELVQALLETGTPTLETALVGAGFTRIGTLQYLRRPWREAPGADGGAWPEGVEVRPWRPGDDHTLAEALEASYEETRDCPELHGMRRTSDVIESHRSTGRWDPRLWWLVLDAGAPRGALLLNPCPDHGNTELVYLGLAPSLRGRGLAGRVLTMGLAALATRKHRTVACAVDARNAPARKLYESFGFRLFAERIAFVRAVAPAR